MIRPPFFTQKISTNSQGSFELRQEDLTGFRCRISPDRLKRRIDKPAYTPPSADNCPFCPAGVTTKTPTFPDGTRISRGESITFPNLYPFARWHTVTVITAAHAPEQFTQSDIEDAVVSATELLSRRDGYSSLNWNYLPSAGASLAHPHLQALADDVPSSVQGEYLSATKGFFRQSGARYSDLVARHEMQSPRYLFGEEIVWHAQAVPLGEKEVRAVLPVSHPSEFGSYAGTFVRGLLRVIGFYRAFGSRAFNMSLFFDNHPKSRYFRAFCSIISRINPNPTQTSDSAFMERLHREPVILTSPEEMGRLFRER